MFKKKHNIHQQELEFALSLLQAHMGPTAIINALKNEGLDDESAIWLFNQARMQKATLLPPDATQYRIETRRRGVYRIIVGCGLALFTIVFFLSASISYQKAMSQIPVEQIILVILFVSSLPFSLAIVDFAMSIFPPVMGLFTIHPEIRIRDAASRTAANYALIIILNSVLSCILLIIALYEWTATAWLSIIIAEFALSRLYTLRYIADLAHSLWIGLGFTPGIQQESYDSPYNWKMTSFYGRIIGERKFIRGSQQGSPKN